MKWQEELKHNVKTGAELAAYLPLTGEEQEEIDRIAASFPMTIPRYYLGLIDKNDPDDPIRRMCVPSLSEDYVGGSFDTSGEGQNTRLEGLQHKYPPTALILSTNRCAMYCRHCFRKRLVGLSEEENLRRFDAVIDYINDHREIDNVLISGGDALMNSNRVLEHYLRRLTAIDHVRMIRIGTRMPVVLPRRITGDAELRNLLDRYAMLKQIYVVTQFNHPRELTHEAAEAVGLLLERRIVVNNQTVLLRGVNDQPQVLTELMNQLTENGLAPYYLFQCRPVTGVYRQFQLPLAQASDIVQEARAGMNGHAKRFRFVMSHVTGKIEIIGRVPGDRIIFQYHQAAHAEDNGRLFTQVVTDDQCWLPDELE